MVYTIIVKCESEYIKKSSVKTAGDFLVQKIFLGSEKMLMKICAKCGRKLPQGTKCICQNDRHKLYNAARRDKDKNQFYQSQSWRRLVAMVKARANGLDEYALSQGCLETGNTVHHIFTIDERPDLTLSLDNLIFLSAKNHNHIHKIYEKDAAEKILLQARLCEIVKGRGTQKSF